MKKILNQTALSSNNGRSPLPNSGQLHYNSHMLDTKTLDGLIVKNPKLHNGRPIIAGMGSTVRAIAIMYKQGLSPEEITGELPFRFMDGLKTLVETFGGNDALRQTIDIPTAL